MIRCQNTQVHKTIRDTAKTKRINFQKGQTKKKTFLEIYKQMKLLREKQYQLLI